MSSRYRLTSGKRYGPPINLNPQPQPNPKARHFSSSPPHPKGQSPNARTVRESHGGGGGDAAAAAQVPVGRARGRRRRHRPRPPPPAAGRRRARRDRPPEGDGVPLRRRRQQGQGHHHHPHEQPRARAPLQERRSCSKFGDAVKGEDAGTRLTMVSTEEVLLVRPRAPGKQAEEPTTSGDPLSMASTRGGALLMLCRICGDKGDHWTSKCPYKDLAPQVEGFVDRPSTPDGRAAPHGERAECSSKQERRC